VSLFRCENCGCVENTATGDYWSRRQRKSGDHRALCSECSPNGGKWHGRFPKQSANGWRIDASGFIWHPDTKDSDITHTRFVGKVPGEYEPGPEKKPEPPLWEGEVGDE
jgi:hypothetical protein